jgi:hypothetical protein
LAAYNAELLVVLSILRCRRGRSSGPDRHLTRSLEQPAAMSGCAALLAHSDPQKTDAAVMTTSTGAS